MSGHSKWANIKHKKEANDQKRGKIFSKLSRLITIAVHEGGGSTDPEKNVKLRFAVSRARAENMPKNNIQRAIDKGAGGADTLLKEVIYEGFGLYDTTFILMAATDNKNRTSSQVRSILEKNGGKLGSVNSVLYQYDKCGLVVVKKSEMGEDAMLKFIDLINATEFEEDDEAYILYIPFEALGAAEEDLSKLSCKAESIDIFYKPHNIIYLDPKEHKRIESIVEALEDLDDVNEPIPFGRINSSWLMSYRINKLSGQAERVSLFFVHKITNLLYCMR